MARTRAFAAAALFGAVVLTVTGCFNPHHPACAFSCATPPHTCPQGFVCGADNLCHDPNSTGICTIDAGEDEAATATEDTAAREALPDPSGDTGTAADTRGDSLAGG